MATKRKPRYTTDEVLQLFQTNKTSSSDFSDKDQDFQRYIGVILLSSEDNDRSEDISDEGDDSANVEIVSASISTEIPQGTDVSGLDSTGIDCTQSSDESEKGNSAQEECDDSSETEEDIQDESDDGREMEQELLGESVDVLSSDSEATSEDEATEGYSSSCSDVGGPTHSARGRGQRGRGRGQSRGQDRGRRRGRGYRMGQGGGERHGRIYGRRQIDLPRSAVAIQVQEEDEYSPLRETGPHTRW